MNLAVISEIHSYEIDDGVYQNVADEQSYWEHVSVIHRNVRAVAINIKTNLKKSEESSHRRQSPHRAWIGKIYKGN